MTRTFQIYGEQVLTDAVVAAGIASSAPPGIGVRHGWRRVGEPMLVTRSAGNRVHDRPVLDVYLDRLGVVGPARSNRELFNRLAFDCIARRGVLGHWGIRTEIDRLAATARGAPVAGFSTYGEIARTRGSAASTTRPWLFFR